MEPYLTRHVSVVVSIVLLLLSSRSMAFPCVQCNSDEHFHETQISAKIKKMVEDSISNMNKEEPDHYYVLQKIASARKKKMGNTKDYLVTYFIVKCSKKEALKKKDKACKVEDNAKRLRCKRVFTYAYGRLLHEMYGKKCEQ
ncbi:hypothetical protein D918_06110 [Trichuris suis]|nr:hypothetical protein D918_06110 [Trichuris suis]